MIAGVGVGAVLLALSYDELQTLIDYYQLIELTAMAHPDAYSVDYLAQVKRRREQMEALI